MDVLSEQPGERPPVTLLPHVGIHWTTQGILSEPSHACGEASPVPRGRPIIATCSFRQLPLLPRSTAARPHPTVVSVWEAQ